jgi:hypothetical protein
MTDQQRGAYTPQQDVPLQFDPRSPASRRPMPMALIASGTLLVVLIAAVAMYYSRGVRGDNEPPRPVGEPVAVLKSAPAVGAQPADAADVDPSAPQNVPGQVPVFAAAPEAPKPRPAPAAPTRLTVQTLSAGDMNKPPPAPVAAPPAKPAVAKTVASNTVTTNTTEPVSELPAAPVAKTVAAKTVAAKTVAPKPAVLKPAVVASAAPTVAQAAAPKAPPIASPGGVRVQIGAFSSAALADKGYSDVSALMPGSMSGHAKHVEPVQKDGSTLYRTSVTGFGDRASATAFCDALKAKGKICFVKS